MMEGDGMGRWKNAMFCPKEDIELTCNVNSNWAGLVRLKTSFFRAVLVFLCPFLPLFTLLTRENGGVLCGLPDLVPRPIINKTILQN
jgi:hypothetical protein